MHVTFVAIIEAFKVYNLLQPNGSLTWHIKLIMGMGMHGHDIDAPLDAYGVFKWGPLKDLLKAIQFCAAALVATNPPTSLGKILEACVYKPLSTCASFLDPDITLFAALYGHQPPHIVCSIHDSFCNAKLVGRLLERDDMFPIFASDFILVHNRIQSTQVDTWDGIAGLFFS
ncbi:putative galactan 1,3-beta-galactosidase [Helianthus anomalus]